jgi:uncharacterized protein YsxB (DUF464 family)
MRGHASVDAGELGNNVVCAAVTALARSFAETVAAEDSRLTNEGGRPPLGVSGEATGPGQLLVEIHRPDSAEAWLRGVTAMVRNGIGRIAGDHPSEVKFLIQGEQDGS